MRKFGPDQIKLALMLLAMAIGLLVYRILTVGR
jgi:hypothetical protein